MSGGVTSRLDFAHAQLKDEHRRLMSLLDRLRAAEHGIDVERLLEELHTTLIDHFSHEQFPGGFYEIMGAHGSTHHGELQELVKEHCMILSVVGGLLEKVRMPGQRADLVDGIASLVAQLDAHEQKEHDLAHKLLSET